MKVIIDIDVQRDLERKPVVKIKQKSEIKGRLSVHMAIESLIATHLEYLVRVEVEKLLNGFTEEEVNERKGWQRDEQFIRR